MKKSKFIKIMFAGVIALTLMSAVNTFAASDNNNYGFEFTIKPWWSNARIPDGQAQFRYSTNTMDQWKVQLNTSGEGAGTRTNFWMENYSGENVTAPAAAYEGDGANYSPTYASASKVNCYLTAENNTYDNSSYYVTGVWDEETGVIAR